MGTVRLINCLLDAEELSYTGFNDADCTWRCVPDVFCSNVFHRKLLKSQLQSSLHKKISVS